MKNLIETYVSKHMLKVYRKSFDQWDSEKQETALEEFLKFAILASYFGNIFIPCTRDIDQIWHKFILETRDYFAFCDRIKPGNYLHHSGVTYDDYCEMKPGEKVIEEDVSVLASYWQNFGPFTEKTIGYWHFGNVLRLRHGMTIDDFNEMISKMATAGDKQEFCNAQS